MIKHRDLPRESQNESVKKYYEIVSKEAQFGFLKEYLTLFFCLNFNNFLLILIFIISIYKIFLNSIFIDRKELQGMVKSLKFLNLEQWFQTLINRNTCNCKIRFEDN